MVIGLVSPMARVRAAALWPKQRIPSKTARAAAAWPEQRMQLCCTLIKSRKLTVSILAQSREVLATVS